MGARMGRDLAIFALVVGGCLGDGRCSGTTPEPCDGCDALAGRDAQAEHLLDRIVDESYCPLGELTVLDEPAEVDDGLGDLLGAALDDVDFTSRQLVCLQREILAPGRVVGFTWHAHAPGVLVAIRDLGCTDSCPLVDTVSREGHRVEVWETPRAPVLSCESRPRCR
ncbi:MAG: hypothetical protein ABIO70_15755 [Pseudomonadota bacterium]